MKNIFLKFQFFILRVKNGDLLLLFQLYSLKFQNLLLKTYNLCLKLRNFLYKRYCRFWFGTRAFYYFAFHGVILDQDLDFLYDDTQHMDIEK